MEEGFNPHQPPPEYATGHYGFTFRTFKRLDVMSSIMHTVQVRSNRVIEGKGLLCELMSLRDNLSVFQPSHAAFSKAEIETLIDYLCTE